MQGSQQGKPREGVVYRKSKEKPGKIMEKWREREKKKKEKKENNSNKKRQRKVGENLISVPSSP